MHRCASVFLVAAFSLLTACKESKYAGPVELPKIQADEGKPSLIRYIRFYGGSDDFGVELNGGSAFIRQGEQQKIRIEIPYEEGLRLLEDFYSIREVETFRGTNSTNRQSSKHVLVMVYDEEPQYYSEETVDYVFDREFVQNGTEIAGWVDRMQSLRQAYK